MSLQQEEVVISGISGKFPECDNIEEFCVKLYEGENLISKENKRFPGELFKGLNAGLLKDLTKFDAEFFSIYGRQRESMDPQSRILLEVCYEAIIDAGINPEEIRGTNTGVYVGHLGSESERFSRKYHDADSFGFVFLGHAQFLTANRVSYVFDFKGPSLVIDAASSSSMNCLDEAVRAIQTGRCDRAIVAGTMLIQNPEISQQLIKLEAVTANGLSRPFDNDADGYVRSETITAVLIQRKTLARRYYAEIVNIDSNTDGYKEQGLLYPSGKVQQELMEKTYSKVGMEPSTIEYFEAHATGTAAGDREELSAVTDVICKNREFPLLIGSVKSNMGHSESASGLCSLAKVIFMMEKGLIAPSINYNTPNKNIPALLDGRIKVVDTPTPYRGGYVAINNFGIGGTNVHTLLKRNPKQEDVRRATSLPKLVAVSGRMEDGVKRLLEKIKNSRNDNVIALIQVIHCLNIPRHPYRGYCLFDIDVPIKEIARYNDISRPVWYIFSGMGSQWPGMGKDLMEFEVFRESVKKCSAVLEPHGKNFYDMIVNGKEELVNEGNVFTAILVIQIAMIDLLNSIDIHPDGIIGHSNGETAAAYADGALTLEQAVLCTYFKSRSILEANLPSGIMASVGLSWSEAAARCPPGVYPACDNSKDNVTVAGPDRKVREFIKFLKEENIFAKEVESAMQVAFHSVYINDMGPLLENYLKKFQVIPCPKERSSRWVSTSVNSSEWNSELAKTCSVEYYVNNTLNPVYFREAVEKIPPNAIVIEISPHCLFQSIMKRSIPTSCNYIGLAKKTHFNNMEFLMSSIGKMYNAGLQPKIQELYPNLEYPVPRGTPMLSPMVEWDHSSSLKTFTYSETYYGEPKFIFPVSLASTKFQHLRGYVIDGCTVFPAAGYLFLVIQALQSMFFKRMESLSVMFENVKFHRNTTFNDRIEVKFCVDILTASGEFEISDSGSIVATGIIKEIVDPEAEMLHFLQVQICEDILLTKNDFYKEMRLRGYDYSRDFQGVLCIHQEGLTGELEWNDDWIIFMDTVMQIGYVEYMKSRNLLTPTGIDKLVIDSKKMYSFKKGESVPVKVDTNMRVIQAGGIEIRGLRYAVNRRTKTHPPVKLEKYSFIPYENSSDLQHDDALSAILQVVLENIRNSELHVLELVGSKKANQLLGVKIAQILADADEPLVYPHITVIANGNRDYLKDKKLASLGIDVMSENDVDSFKTKEINLLVGTDILTLAEEDRSCFYNFKNFLNDGCFTLLEESSNVVISESTLDWEEVCCYTCEQKQLILLRKPSKLLQPIVVNFTEDNYKWMGCLKSALKENEKEDRRIIVVSQEQKTSGIVGLMNCLRKEYGGIDLRCIFIQDETAPLFSLNNDFYGRQFKKDLYMNIYFNKQWGSYRHLKLRNSEVRDVEHAHIDILTPGNLSTLTWIQSPAPASDDPNLCYVYYSALNFRDVMLTTGRLPVTGEDPHKKCMLGLEFSGRNTQGKRVFGIVENGAMSTTLVTNPLTLFDVPDNWTLEQAATVAFAYITAYYALIVRGQMKPGEKILLNTDTDCVGLAAINIALHVKATVYVTVRSQEKSDYIKKAYPALTGKNVINTKDQSFEQHVLRETGGKGVDILLNSLSGEKIQTPIRCLVTNGKFIQIEKCSFSNSSTFGTNLLLKNASFHAVVPDNILNQCNGELTDAIQLMKDGIKCGVVQPFPATVFSVEKATDGFQFLLSGEHIGKVMLKIREEEKQNVVIPNNKFISAAPRVYFDPKKVYVVIGGLGGFGLELADWLVSRGARKIVLNSRSGVKDGYQASRMKIWETDNVSVTLSTVDSCQEEGVEELIKESSKLGPIAGIFNLASVLRDGLFDNLIEEDFEICLKPKVNITKHLDKISRRRCPELDYFVVFSSVSSGRGSGGQTNYALGNSVVERICDFRRAENLPGLAIQWGPIGDLGSAPMEVKGLAPQKISSCISTLDILLCQRNSVVSSTVVTDKSKITPLKKDIFNIIGDIMGISNIKEINPNMTLMQLGVDSFIVHEVKHTLERELSTIMSINEVRNLTLKKLKEMKK